jgi:hypothetical protein
LSQDFCQVHDGAIAYAMWPGVHIASLIGLPVKIDLLLIGLGVISQKDAHHN